MPKRDHLLILLAHAKNTMSKAAALAMVAGCTGGRQIPQRVSIPFDMSAGRASEEAAPAEILAAHFALDDSAMLDGLDGIVLVLSTDVDPASVFPEAFWIARETGERVRANEARLSPASEGDENRTLSIAGAFGAPTENPPVSIAIYGSIFAEDGRPLHGLAADVRPFAEPDVVVLAQRLEPAAGLCEGAAAVVRTYWSDLLRGVSVDDLASVRVRMTDGRAITPIAFDDHVAGDEIGEDNVLDLCLDDPQKPVHLSIAAGTFEDCAAHPTGAVQIEITDAAS